MWTHWLQCTALAEVLLNLRGEGVQFQRRHCSTSPVELSCVSGICRDRLKTTKCIHINTLKHFTHPPFRFLSFGWNSFLKEIINRKRRDVHIKVAILLKKKKRKTSAFLPFQKIQRTSETILPLTYIIPLKRFSDSSEVILESLEYTRIIRVI